MWLQKVSYSPHRRSFLLKPSLEEMYEAKLEFPGGGGVRGYKKTFCRGDYIRIFSGGGGERVQKNLLSGRLYKDIFWNYT